MSSKRITPADVIKRVKKSHADRHFVDSDHILLDHYAQLVCQEDRLLREVANAAAVVGDKANPAFTTLSRVSKAVCDLGNRLRITPQTRHRPSRTALPAPGQMEGINNVGPHGKRAGMLGTRRMPSKADPRARLLLINKPKPAHMQPIGDDDE